MIVNITDEAKNRLNEMFSDFKIENKLFRVYVRDMSSWYGPIFDVALDEPTINDNIYVCDDYNVIVNKELSLEISVINVYFKPYIAGSGFKVTTDLIWKDEYYYNNTWSKPW